MEKGFDPLKYLLPLYQIYLSGYILSLSDVGKSSLILIIIAIGSISGVLAIDQTIRNSTKGEIRWLRLDTTLFFIASCALYQYQHTFNSINMLSALTFIAFIYLSYFFTVMNLQISRFLGIPFFSLKKN